VSSSEAQARMDSSCGCQAMEVMGPGREGEREDPHGEFRARFVQRPVPSSLLPSLPPSLHPSLPPSFLTFVPCEMRDGCGLFLGGGKLS